MVIIQWTIKSTLIKQLINFELNYKLIIELSQWKIPYFYCKKKKKNYLLIF